MLRTIMITTPQETDHAYTPHSDEIGDLTSTSTTTMGIITHEHHHVTSHQERCTIMARSAHPSRSFSEIRDLIEGSELSDFVKQHATSIFRRIGKAESKIHGASIEEVQFHEVGALDSIVDVVLSCVGIRSAQGRSGSIFQVWSMVKALSVLRMVNIHCPGLPPLKSSKISRFARRTFHLS